MYPRPQRRRSDPGVPHVTIIHAVTNDCPDVKTGLALRCQGHELVPTFVPAEGPAEHLRNALAVIRLNLDLGAVLYGNEPCIAIHMKDLARLQARIEAALSILEHGRLT